MTARPGALEQLVHSEVARALTEHRCSCTAVPPPQRGSAEEPARPFPRAFLRVQEAADVLAVPVKQIYTLVQSGELPHRRIGKHIRIPDPGVRGVHR
ncbi:helix-turn-helix domain-containing protein [Pseudonocardia xishanensis]|uniref:Helix-turn-helix domain-containing protein n=1 Tax=Pseudonocardia xishanensis TaxID=630995 RepID=A0ABP8RZB3_9PSEU